MGVYLQQIEQLVALQRVDDAIYHVKKDLEQAPKELENLEKRFASEEQQRARILDKLTHMQEQQKRLALEIDDESIRLKKSKSKLMQVGNTREYHAMVREMDGIEKMNRGREEEKLILLEELQAQNEALADIDRTYLAIKAEVEVKRESLQERMDKAKTHLEELQTVRNNTGSEVPAPVFQRYEFIRFRLEHPVIVPVREGVCSGCHIAIPPQAFIELQRGQQILSCPNCQRLIYWYEHFTAPMEEKPAAEVVSAPVTFLND